jgi:hypothetical protein
MNWLRPSTEIAVSARFHAPPSSTSIPVSLTLARVVDNDSPRPARVADFLPSAPTTRRQRPTWVRPSTS